MLKTKDKRGLRSMSISSNSLFQVAKYGLSIDLLDDIDHALSVYKLVKINILSFHYDQIDNIIERVTKYTNSILIQVIGRTIFIYRNNDNGDHLL